MAPPQFRSQDCSLDELRSLVRKTFEEVAELRRPGSAQRAICAIHRFLLTAGNGRTCIGLAP